MTNFFNYIAMCFVGPFDREVPFKQRVWPFVGGLILVGLLGFAFWMLFGFAEMYINFHK